MSNPHNRIPHVYIVPRLSVAVAETAPGSGRFVAIVRDSYNDAVWRSPERTTYTAADRLAWVHVMALMDALIHDATDATANDSNPH